MTTSLLAAQLLPLVSESSGHFELSGSSRAWSPNLLTRSCRHLSLQVYASSHSGTSMYMSQMFVAALRVTHASTLGSPAITRTRHSPDPWSAGMEPVRVRVRVVLRVPVPDPCYALNCQADASLSTTLRIDPNRARPPLQRSMSSKQNSPAARPSTRPRIVPGR